MSPCSSRPDPIRGNAMDRASQYSQDQSEAARAATFEETYPRYEFAEMVRIGLVLGEWVAAAPGWLARMSRRVQGAQLGMVGKASAGEMPPAE
jgi:hypothetical protein